MTVTHTEWAVTDLPFSRAYGTGKRRRIVAFRGTTTSTADTITVGSADTNIADIEGILWCTIGDAAKAAGSALPTWSTKTLTLGTRIGAWELGVLVNMT